MTAIKYQRNGLHDSLCTLKVVRSAITSFEIKQSEATLILFTFNTRYGRLVTPYPTKILTLSEMPSFAWRTTIHFSQLTIRFFLQTFHISFILVHNHPSGDQHPLKEDQKITEQMKEIGRTMKIPLKDYMIIGKDWFSFFKRDCRGNG